MKQISFILLFLFSLKCGAQNELKLFGTTLHFDSEVVCKLLYSQCPPENKSIKKGKFYFSTFKDTITLSKKDKKKIKLFLRKKETTSEATTHFNAFDDKDLLAFDYIIPFRFYFRVYVNSDDMWTAATFPDFHHHRTTHVYKSPGFYKYLLKKRRREERQNRKKDKNE